MTNRRGTWATGTTSFWPRLEPPGSLYLSALSLFSASPLDPANKISSASQCPKRTRAPGWTVRVSITLFEGAGSTSLSVHCSLGAVVHRAVGAVVHRAVGAVVHRAILPGPSNPRDEHGQRGPRQSGPYHPQRLPAREALAGQPLGQDIDGVFRPREPPWASTLWCALVVFLWSHMGVLLAHPRSPIR